MMCSILKWPLQKVLQAENDFSWQQQFHCFEVVPAPQTLVKLSYCAHTFPFVTSTHQVYKFLNFLYDETIFIGGQLLRYIKAEA